MTGIKRASMPAMVILAGGLGTRLSEETGTKPKPMVTVGGRPMLWHIMKMCSAAGVSRFVIALGYRGDVVKDYVLQMHHMSASFSVDLKSGEVSRHDQGAPEDWIVTALDTGEETSTGGRIKRALDFLDEDRVMVTYGDAVSDVDVRSVVEFHDSHQSLATVTAVRPPARFGRLDLEGDLVVRFGEKPQAEQGWINGGFFVLDRDTSAWIDDDLTVFEHEPLTRLASAGQLRAFKHEGFWHPMDTLREREALEAMWASGSPPWRRW